MIVYITIVQWQYSNPHPKITARFELAKGLLATAIWLWLLLDAIYYTPIWRYYRQYKPRIVLFRATSIIILCSCSSAETQAV